MRVRGRKRAKGNFLPSLFKVLLILIFLLGFFYILRNRDYLVDTLGGRGRVAILFYSPKDSVLGVLDSNSSSLVLIGIPSELFSEVTPDYGDYRFGAIYRLGEIDGIGKELVKKASYNLFGLKPDGLMLINSELDIGMETTVTPVIKKEVFQNILRGSNLGYFKFWWKAKTLKPSEVKFFNLRVSDSVSELVLPDGSSALKFDSYYFDKQIGSVYLKDSLAVAENLKAEVLNGSKISGLGEKTARYLNNFGVSVFSVSNTDEEVFKCKILYNANLKKSYVLFRTAKDLGCTFEEYSEEALVKTDITIVLGNNF